MKFNEIALYENPRIVRKKEFFVLDKYQPGANRFIKISRKTVFHINILLKKLTNNYLIIFRNLKKSPYIKVPSYEIVFVIRITR